jgi:signal transduction histidine kinase
MGTHVATGPGETFDSIEDAVRRMVTMLDQVLTIGKADANLLEFRPKPMNLPGFCVRNCETRSWRVRLQTIRNLSRRALALTLELGDDMAHG